jgi:hypothetical protein
MAMPGMSGSAAAGNPALTLVLVLFMLGYVLWVIDRLASLSRSTATGISAGTAAGGPPPAAAIAPAASSAFGTSGPYGTAHAGTPDRPVLSPRLAAGYKIAMGAPWATCLS